MVQKLDRKKRDKKGPKQPAIFGFKLNPRNLFKSYKPYLPEDCRNDKTLPGKVDPNRSKRVSES